MQSNVTSGGTAFNFFDQQFAENPFTLLAMARSMAPIVPVPLPMEGEHKAWMITRMEEAVQVLKDNKRFTVDRNAVSSGEFFRRQQHELADTPGLLDQSMISVDEPDHRRLRGLVSKAFTPKYIQSLRPSIQRIADELLDGVQDQGHMDLVHDYAYPLPINVISDMLGVPTKNRAQIRQWSEALVTSFSGDQQQLNHVRAFSSYIVELVAEKRRNPQDDLISQLIQAETEGDSLNEQELLSMVALLIFAGHETTSNLIGIGTLVLLDNPQQLAKLKGDMSLVPSAVEELLRINGPVLMPAPRFATEDIEIGGQHIGKGDIIITALASANRDETQFT